MPSICLAAPVCLDAAKCMGASKGMRDIQTYGGIQTYRGIKTYGGIQMYGVHMDTSQSDKVFFLCIVYVQQTSKHHLNIQGASKHMAVSKHTGGIQTYAVHPSIWSVQTYRGTILHAFLSHKVGFATCSI